MIVCHIGKHKRFWEAYYSSHHGSFMDHVVWRYSSSCPGNITDPHQSIGKFRRWNKITRKLDSRRTQKAAWMYWRTR